MTYQALQRAGCACCSSLTITLTTAVTLDVISVELRRTMMATVRSLSGMALSKGLESHYYSAKHYFLNFLTPSLHISRDDSG